MFSIKKNSICSWMFLTILSLVITLAVFGCNAATDAPETAENNFITLATTTSTNDSGLLKELLPAFTEKYGIEVRVLSKGTGQALEIGQRGDADVLLVHDRASELQMVEEGYFTDRHDVMFNDFVIVGPANDPANLKNAENIGEALKTIAEGSHLFVSRGDDSGTHRKELSLWEKAGAENSGAWYISAGQGMGATLNLANEKLGYTLTDRATYLSTRDTLELIILFEGDTDLMNQYGVMAVSKEKHPHVKYDDAMKLIEFLMSPEGQQAVAAYKIDGEQLFFPGLGLDNNL